jgi:glycosyltransferase involved in cell wall biosynthesis
MPPRVSVIIRTYNRAHFLPQSIDSVLAQTFGDLELIVVDDGSTDDTPAVLYSYGDKLRPLFLGRIANRASLFNAGIRAAGGEFLAFLDSDDIWLRDKLERQLRLLDGDSGFGFAYGNTQALYPDGEMSKPELRPEEIVAGSVLRAMVRNMCIHPSTAVVRAALIEQVGLFDQQKVPCEDFYYFLRLARAADAVCVREPVCLIREHAGQQSKLDGLASYERPIDALEGLLHDGDLAWPLRLEIHRSIARHHAHLAKKRLARSEVARARAHALRSFLHYPLHRPGWRMVVYSLLASAGVYRPPRP